MQVNRQKTTLKEKITHSLKNYVAFLFTFFEKVFAISKFLTTVFRCNVLKPFVFYLFAGQFMVFVSSPLQGENVLILQLFLTREGKKLF